MQQTQARTAGAVAVKNTEVGIAPIWLLVAGVVLLLAALGPSFVRPATTSPARPATVSSGPSPLGAAER